MIKFLEKIPLYPFLIAIYPVVYLVSINISEIDLSDGLRSGIIFFSIGLVSFIFFLVFTRDIRRSGLYALVIVLLFFLVFFLLYAPIYRALREVTFLGKPMGRHRYLIPFFALLIFATVICLLVFGRHIPMRWLKNISLAANSIAILLTIFPVIVMASTVIKNKNESSKSEENLPAITALTPTENSQFPDIYYIILDMNTNENALRRLMDYDDSNFTKGLQEKGFFVSQCSQSNYENTRQSLTSSLNLDYLQDLGMVNTAMSTMYPVMQENRVMRMLKDIGYTTYTFKSGYNFVDIKKADHFSDPASGALNLLTYPGITTFESLILSDSAGQLLYENRSSLSKQMQTIIDAPYMERREDILNALDSLPEIAKQDGPKFIYAHILAPHDPFVFDANGDPAFRRTPFTDAEDPEFGVGYGWDSYKQPYADEVAYLHKRVLDMVNQILANSITAPIIIIQGDHGIPRSSTFNAQFQILNAYYFPNITDTGLYNTISPVNSFRLVFNNYFGADFSLLPDQSYTTEEKLTLFTQTYPCP